MFLKTRYAWEVLGRVPATRPCSVKIADDCRAVSSGWGKGAADAAGAARGAARSAAGEEVLSCFLRGPPCALGLAGC